jgi:hypothetical protein
VFGTAATRMGEREKGSMRERVFGREAWELQENIHR